MAATGWFGVLQNCKIAKSEGPEQVCRLLAGRLAGWPAGRWVRCSNFTVHRVRIDRNGSAQFSLSSGSTQTRVASSEPPSIHRPNTTAGSTPRIPPPALTYAVAVRTATCRPEHEKIIQSKKFSGGCCNPMFVCVAKALYVAAAATSCQMLKRASAFTLCGYSVRLSCVSKSNHVSVVALAALCCCCCGPGGRLRRSA